ncbi:hypothetical protein ABFS82_12G162200 [Erythranthe guttata]|uniref:Ribosomal RNA-processing protein 14/surfeit locus protein 6 C-terminal domain-containing protein n=1 Tax=Erythranthe guttata TaxID=4155 RepID=A0A022RG44_ERYGU|nr:PREDICTED: ribosomal RNA-processing protein 14-like [Erythranthe guttata]EYU38758.1 hypothetical protein MIMGU_mgv1a027168mg [Erythranthe guttata]|eukprot:XP_012836225.1 PREDICTED: ribosomal RNA-processing protein 14-like [Erythranthe guttata]
MKKKKQTKSSSAVAAASAADDIGGLKSMIHSQREFFDHLVDLIPARFYLTNDDDEDSKPWIKGLSKAAKASLKQQTRENIKLARRNRFDPDGEPSSTLQLQQQQQASSSDDEDLDGEPESKPSDMEEDKKSVTYEELRQKLRRKIESLRGNRSEKSIHEKKVKLKRDGKKRKRDGDENDGGHSGKGAQSNGNENDEEEEIIEYGKVKLGDEDEGKHAKKKSKLSKAKELEKAKKLQEAKRENPTVAEKEAWKVAAARAMGVKVHDNPRLIRESMRRDKKKKEKNAEKWKERVETQEKMKGERQRKRRDNIVGRINEKKSRKIAKREKKLMRPGFEGRKEGFITPK